MPLFDITENDRKIYETELRDFLPDEIFDVHAHIWRDELRIKHKDEPKRKVTWPTLVAKDDPIEDLAETYRLMFPGKKVCALVFANEGGNGRLNDYVKKSSAAAGFPALYFSHPSQSGEEVESRIRDGGFVGIKSYLDLSPSYIPEREIRIFDFFPEKQLEVMNRIGAIVMLHIPRPGRLKDPVNLAQIAEIKEKYPRVRLIIAHIGRAYTKDDIGSAFDILDRYPDLMYDFTANCCEYAITEVLRHAGADHLMFGTDMPILRMRTHRTEENGTYVNLVPPGLYGDVSGDPHMREVSSEEAEKITFFAYEELLALKRACRTLGIGREGVEKIMCGNAVSLIRGAVNDIYGK